MHFAERTVRRALRGLRQPVVLLVTAFLVTSPLFALNPSIVSATITYGSPTPSTNKLTISGSNFSSDGGVWNVSSTATPTVTLNGTALPVISFTNTQIVATFASSLPPGSYSLTVTNGQDTSSFTLANGAAGPQGLQGLPGAQGPQGLPGTTGLVGPAGAQGLPGATGLVGPAGATGLQGLPGATGPQGLTGAQGLQGLTGASGPVGPAGATGPEGLPGAQGPQGLPGATGPAGPAGAATASAICKVLYPTMPNAYCATYPNTPMIVFTTAGSYTANLGGIAGANASCQTEAENAGLPGTYKAWLSSSNPGENPAQSFTHSNRPYVLADGLTQVAENWAGLISGTLSAAISKTPALTKTTNDFAWTNTNVDGTPTSLTQTCNNWTSAVEVPDGYFGVPTTAISNWTAGNGAGNCSDTYVGLYCVQQ